MADKDLDRVPVVLTFADGTVEELWIEEADMGDKAELLLTLDEDAGDFYLVAPGFWRSVRSG